MTGAEEGARLSSLSSSRLTASVARACLNGGGSDEGLDETEETAPPP